jgi:hypothetical protein
MKTALILMIATVAALSAYAMQRPATDDALPAAQGDVPQIVIVAKRWDAAERQR